MPTPFKQWQTDMGEDKWKAFTAWREATNVELPSRDDVSDWHASSEYDEWRMEQLADDWQADDAAYEAYRAREQERLAAEDARRRHGPHASPAVGHPSDDGAKESEYAFNRVAL